MSTCYTETLPLATVQSFHDDVEARPDNPARTEPLDVGDGYPPGYVPPRDYTWTYVAPIRAFDPDGDELPVLGEPMATLAIPRGQYGVGWVENIISQLSPGMVYSETNWANLTYYTNPVSMAEGLAIAADANSLWGNSQSDCVLVPRPLEGEQPDETASYVVIAVANQNQHATISGRNPGLEWTDRVLPAPEPPPE